jgi:photosystem II stability/assembly factor-like uncharacterized protein
MRRFWAGMAIVSMTLLTWWMGMIPGQLTQPKPGRSHWFSDAAIRSLWFVDDQEGWAVGDDGLILHTIDGGQTWERQMSGTQANLRQVQFVSPFVGFAVGEEAWPELPLSVGVVLGTRDGGANWRILSERTMPGLYQVHFFDERRGVVAGDTCDAFPAGVWETEDGGQSWRAVAGTRQPGWYATAWLRPDFGILAGRQGKLALLSRPRSGSALAQWQPIFYQARSDNLPGSSFSSGSSAIHSVCWTGRTGWACGDRGLLLVCRDPHGRDWQPLTLPIEEPLREMWDFHAIHFVGDFGWVAGRPGSVILHTWDGGKTWQVQRTPQSLPIYALHFVNENCGWAAGAGGTILHTRDGGKTWQVQRRGVQRAAALIVTARAEFLPCELLTSLAADAGYHTVALRVLSEDSSSPDHTAHASERFHTVVRRLGGICGETLTGWQVPEVIETASAEKLAEILGNGNSARTLERLQQQLVLTLRIWRPDVVITDHPDVQGPGGVEGALVALAVSKAFRLAENVDVCREQITRWQLQPWSVGKLYSSWDGSEGATVSADWNALRPALGRTVWEAALVGRHLLAPLATVRFPNSAVSSAQRFAYFRLLDSRLENAQQHRELMEGIHAPPGGPNRREPAQTVWDESQTNLAQRRARKMEEVLGLADRLLASPHSGERWLAALPEELALLDETQSAEMLWQLALQCIARGQWGFAKEVFVSLLERHPDSPLAPAAASWLVAFLSSSEARRRAELRHFLCDLPLHQEKSPSNSAASPTAQQPSPAGSRSAPLAGKPQPSSTELNTILQRRREDWRFWERGALLAGDVLTAYGPLFWLEPRVQFCLLAVQRRRANPAEVLAGYTRFRLHLSGGPWYEAAASEIAFLRPGVPVNPSKTDPAEPNNLARKRAYLCSWTNQPPYLDGELDDEVWRSIPPILFRNVLAQTSDTYPSEAYLAYDARFLYVALRCKHPLGCRQEPVRPRSRDADLRGYDRVYLLLDLDRDYVTCYRLEVDQRGCVFEECWGDRTWNPKWFVASKSGDTVWQAELAIPWTELVREAPNHRQTWAFNLVRIIPQKGLQAVSAPAGVANRPEGMVLLTFSESR